MKIEINPQQIAYDTGKASLIKIPRSKWQFWLTNKCVYKHDYGYTIYLNEDYSYYTAAKQSKLKGEIDGAALIDAFSDYEVYQRAPDVIVTKHTPKPVEPLKERKIDNDLIR